jgi:hypothetical protein
MIERLESYLGKEFVEKVISFKGEPGENVIKWRLQKNSCTESFLSVGTYPRTCGYIHKRNEVKGSWAHNISSQSHFLSSEFLSQLPCLVIFLLNNRSSIMWSLLTHLLRVWTLLSSLSFQPNIPMSFSLSISLSFYSKVKVNMKRR